MLPVSAASRRRGSWQNGRRDGVCTAADDAHASEGFFQQRPFTTATAAASFAATAAAIPAYCDANGYEARSASPPRTGTESSGSFPAHPCHLCLSPESAARLSERAQRSSPSADELRPAAEAVPEPSCGTTAASGSAGSSLSTTSEPPAATRGAAAPGTVGGAASPV